MQVSSLAQVFMLFQLWAFAVFQWLIHTALGAHFSYYAVALIIQTKEHHKCKECPCVLTYGTVTMQATGTQNLMCNLVGFYCFPWLECNNNVHWDELGK